MLNFFIVHHFCSFNCPDLSFATYLYPVRELKALHTVGNALLPSEAYEKVPLRRDYRVHSQEAAEMSSVDGDEGITISMEEGVEGSDDYDDEEECLHTGELQTPPRWRRRPSPTKPPRQPAPLQQCSPPLSPSRSVANPSTKPDLVDNQGEDLTPAHLKRATSVMSSAREAMKAVKVTATRVASRCEINYAHRSHSSGYESEHEGSISGADNAHNEEAEEGIKTALPSAHIVSVYDAFTDPEHGTVCLVLEFMNAGSLQVSDQ